MNRNVVVIGGGLAGLAASIFLARSGRAVTVFEKRRPLGGRAITSLRQGFRFNLGPHSLLRFGAAAAVYRQLGVPVKGWPLKAAGTALLNGDESTLPTSLLSLMTTSLLGFRGQREVLGALLRLRKADAASVGRLSVREWLDGNLSDPMARLLFESRIRLFTFSNDPEQSALLALAQLRTGLRGALYLEEGWQQIVDGLHAVAVAAGVSFVTSSRVIRIDHDGSAVRGVELGGLELDADRMDTQALALPVDASPDEKGAFLKADTVIAAVDAATAAELVGESEVALPWKAMRPVRVSTLDVALHHLPQPKKVFAIALDQPLHMAVHSAAARLTPKGGALLHAVRYGATGNPEEEHQLELLLDQLQPGWRDAVVHRRFLPAVAASSTAPDAATPRPPVVTAIRGLYVAGDWTGSEGMLSDAALASARTAARAIAAS